MSDIYATLFFSTHQKGRMNTWANPEEGLAPTKNRPLPDHVKPSFFEFFQHPPQKTHGNTGVETSRIISAG